MVEGPTSLRKISQNSLTRKLCAGNSDILSTSGEMLMAVGTQKVVVANIHSGPGYYDPSPRFHAAAISQ